VLSCLAGEFDFFSVIGLVLHLTRLINIAFDVLICSIANCFVALCALAYCMLPLWAVACSCCLCRVGLLKYGYRVRNNGPSN
jgi:hypothetical protein